ncbi:MAG: PDR/VanB family oxidoreductase [Pseudomonadota bacterium]
MNLINVTVAEKRAEAEGICSFVLVGAQGDDLPPFGPGAHIDVHLPGQLVRQYSLCNDASTADHYQIGVLRDARSRGGSAAMHEQVKEGDTLRISAPKNHFELVPATHTLLFAGGIGITPLLCMAQRLASTGASFELHYCARSPGHAAFLAQLLDAPFAARVHTYFDSGPDEQRMDVARLLAVPHAATRVYVCGPAGYIDHVTGAAASVGWAPEQVHVEHFGAANAAHAGDTPFDVEIASSGMRFSIPPDRSVLHVLLEHGIDIPASCEQGVCGTCVTGVLAGVPDHRDHYFNSAEHARNDSFTPCCSRARTASLVLDL